MEWASRLGVDIVECGGCTECCTAFPVVELNKPAWKYCTLCKNGCTVYELRPQSCQDCFCCYRKSPTGLKKYRPDKCGVIFEGVNPKLVVGTVVRETNIDVADQIEAFRKQGVKVILKQREENDSSQLYN